MDKKLFNKLLKNLSIAKYFNKLYAFYYPRIVHHIFFKFHSKNLGEDVAQDFFLKLLDNGVDDYIEHPNAWVYTVCDNLAKDTLKKKSASDVSLENIDLPAPNDPFEKILLGDFDDLLKVLDAQSRDIIIMHFYEGYQLKEIAEILDINYNTVRKKFSRSLKKLRI